jgi:hypothetical protein
MRDAITLSIALAIDGLQDAQESFELTTGTPRSESPVS